MTEAVNPNEHDLAHAANLLHRGLLMADPHNALQVCRLQLGDTAAPHPIQLVARCSPVEHDLRMSSGPPLASGPRQANAKPAPSTMPPRTFTAGSKTADRALAAGPSGWASKPAAAPSSPRSCNIRGWKFIPSTPSPARVIAAPSNPPVPRTICPMRWC